MTNFFSWLPARWLAALLALVAAAGPALAQPTLTVTTSKPTSVTEDQANLGGAVSNKTAVTAQGVVYSTTNPVPTISDTRKDMSFLPGTNSFGRLLTAGSDGIQSGTLYIVRAFATTSAGTIYGDTVVLHTKLTQPTVSVLSGQPMLNGNPLLYFNTPGYTINYRRGNITPTSVTVTVTPSGGRTPVVFTVPYSISNSYTQPSSLPDDTYTVSATVTANNFPGSLIGLVTSAPSIGQTFTIDATPPTVTVSGPAGSTTRSTPIPFTVTFSEPVTKATGIRSTTSTTAFAASDVTVTNGTLTSGSFSSSGPGPVSGSGTTYTFTVTPTTPGTATTVSVAANKAQDAATNGNAASNTFAITYALPTPPVLTTDTALPLTGTSVTVSSTVTDDGGRPVTARGFVYSATSPLPTLATGTDSPAGTGAGSYSAVISGLVPGTRYYVRAYATNSLGTSYASALSVTPTLSAQALAFGAPTAYSQAGPSFNNSSYNLARLVVSPLSGFGGDRIYYTEPNSNPPSSTITSLAAQSPLNPAVLRTYTAGGTNPTGLAFGDLNGNGITDLVSANAASSNVSVLLDGLASIALPYSTGAGSAPQGVAVGDVDGDGKRDIITANTGTSTVGVLLRTGSATGTPTFASTQYPTASNSAPKDVALGDLDGDGRPDVVTTGSAVGVLLSSTRTGSALFGAVATYGGGGSWVTLGDVDANGSLDIVTEAGVLLNTGTGTFGALLPSGAGGAAAGDLNLDGKLDIVVAGSYSGVGVRLGTGGGQFGPATFYSVSSSLAGVNVLKATVGDVNNDGRPDIVVAGFDGFFNTLAVLLNTTAPSLVPVLTSLSAPSGPVGTSLTLTGLRLGVATGVSFNGVAATTFTAVNATTVTATVPAGATSGDVTVTTAGGVSNGLPFAVTSPNMVINTPGQTIAAGTYSSITVNNSGVATLSGDVTVTGSLTVNSGATLNDNCAVISGPGSFTLAAGGTLGICSGAGISSGATGAVQVTGARSFSADASYVYNGSTPQATGSSLPSQVRNLTTTNASNLTLSAATSVTQVLTIGGTGNLTTNGNLLTLLSSAGGTALLVNSSTGVVAGNLTAQRYIDPSVNPNLGYRHFSAPVSTATVGSLATSSFTPVVNPAYNASAQPGTVAPFPTVFGYDQARLATASSNLAGFDKGWFSPTTTSDALAVGRGYTVSLGAGQLTSFTGPQNNAASQPISLTLARNAAGTPNASSAGFHLVGNPFPAPLDYSLVAAADRVGLDPTIYVFTSSAANQYQGSYRAILNGVGGSAILPLAQAFFVHVTSGATSATLNFRNAQRATSYVSPAYQRAIETRPLVQLTLQGAGSATGDDAYVYFEPGATDGYEPAFDALKLPNSTGLNLATSVGSQQLAIDGRLPLGNAQRVVPLVVGVPTAGSYSLTATQLLNLGGVPVYLRDLLTGALLDLAQQPVYQFTVSTAGVLLTSRFELVFSPQQALATVSGAVAQQVAIYPNPARQAVVVALPASLGHQAVTATLLDALGRETQTTTLPAQGTAAHQLDLTALPAGVYALRLRTSAGVVVKKLVVE